MIRLIFCLRRVEGMTHAEFDAHWRDHHGPLVASHAELLGIRRYVQLQPSNAPEVAALARSRNDLEPFDGIAELWFEDVSALRGGDDLTREAARQLLHDERHFIDLDRSPIWVFHERDIAPSVTRTERP